MKLLIYLILAIVLCSGVFALSPEIIVPMHGNEQITVTNYGYEQLFFMAYDRFVSPFPLGVPFPDDKKDDLALPLILGALVI